MTICTHDRECLFGEIVNETMNMNEYGRIITEEWAALTEVQDSIEIGAFVDAQSFSWHPNFHH